MDPPHSLVRQFYGSASTFRWDDDEGVTHEVIQRDGKGAGRPVDASITRTRPAQSFWLQLATSCSPTERLLVFLFDLYALCSPHRVGRCAHLIATSALGGLPDLGPSREGPKSGTGQARHPRGWRALTEAARLVDPEAVAWRGDPLLPPSVHKVKIFGTLLGHPDFVRAHLAIPPKPRGFCCNGSLPSRICKGRGCCCSFYAQSRANYLLTVLPPDLAFDFAAEHTKIYIIERTFPGKYIVGSERY